LLRVLPPTNAGYFPDGGETGELTLAELEELHQPEGWTASRLERLLARRDDLERAVARVQYNADMEVASLRASLDIVNEAIREEADVYDRNGE
jgi:hypothetical protein